MTRLTPGLWYVRSTLPPGYTVVDVLDDQLSTTDPKHQMVFLIDREGDADVDDFTFIAPVPPPP
jgi:hypothetical protein